MIGTMLVVVESGRKNRTAVRVFSKCDSISIIFRKHLRQSSKLHCAKDFELMKARTQKLLKGKDK